MSLCLTSLHLYPLARTQNLTLQIETATLLRIVHVEQFLESLHHLLEVCFTGLRGLHVEDLACFVEGDAGGGEGVTGLAVCALVFGCGGGLLVGFSEGTTEDTRAGYDDLGNDAVGLVGESKVSMAISEQHEKGDYGIRA